MQEKLRQLQLTQVEMLKEIDAVCRKYEIKYSLYAGTLIGAVRHQGFIPWDDDIDICMTRSHYDRFLEVWYNDEHPGLLLQNKENSPGFTQSFTKIRKDHTTFLQEGEPNDQYHIGIFIDIFPFNRIPSGKVKRSIFQMQCLLNLMLTREFLPINGNKIEKILTKILFLLIPKKKRTHVREKLLSKIKCWNDTEKLDIVGIETLDTIMMPLPADLMDEYIEMEFEGEKFMVMKKWDEYLTLYYHDYMKFPPEEERVWKHTPKILDFEHNYDEIVE